VKPGRLVVVVALIVSLVTLVVAFCSPPAYMDDNRYGYPEHRQWSRPRQSPMFFLTVLGDPEIYVIRPEPVYVVPIYESPAYYAPAPRRWAPASCRRLGSFAVDWREQCRWTK